MLSLGRNRITDICQEIGLSKGTAHRLLKTLEQCGFVFQDAVSHRYYLGHLIIKLSSNPNITHQNLIVCAYDELKMLRDSSGETTALFIPIGNRHLWKAMSYQCNSIGTLNFNQTCRRCYQ